MFALMLFVPYHALLMMRGTVILLTYSSEHYLRNQALCVLELISLSSLLPSLLYTDFFPVSISLLRRMFGERLCSPCPQQILHRHPLLIARLMSMNQCAKLHMVFWHLNSHFKVLGNIVRLTYPNPSMIGLYDYSPSSFPTLSSIKLRTLLLQRGLTDRSSSVTNECLKMLKEEWLMRCCDGDPITLLRYLDVETYESVGETVMDALLKEGAVQVQEGQSIRHFLSSTTNKDEGIFYSD